MVCIVCGTGMCWLCGNPYFVDEQGDILHDCELPPGVEDEDLTDDDVHGIWIG